MTYAVSATDDTDPNPAVSCAPPSGSVFPLRDTTVSCIARYSLTRLGSSLPDKLRLAIAFSAAGEVIPACGVLTAFLNEVRAQTGKALTMERAAELTERAIRIRNVLGC